MFDEAAQCVPLGQRAERSRRASHCVCCCCCSVLACCRAAGIGGANKRAWQKVPTQPGQEAALAESAGPEEREEAALPPASDEEADAIKSLGKFEVNGKPVREFEVTDKSMREFEVTGKSSMREFEVTGKQGKGKKRRLRPSDIGSPRDFTHVAHVAPRPIFKVDLNDPDIKFFLQQAGVTEEHLAKPEVYETVVSFIHAHGVDRVRGEGHVTAGAASSHAEHQTKPAEVAAGDASARRDSSSSGSSEAPSSAPLIAADLPDGGEVAEGLPVTGPETKGALPRKLALWLQPKRKKQKVEVTPKPKKPAKEVTPKLPKKLKEEVPPKPKKIKEEVPPKPKKIKEEVPPKQKKVKEEVTPKPKKFILKAPPKPKKSKIEEIPDTEELKLETPPKVKKTIGIKGLFTRKRNSSERKSSVKDNALQNDDITIKKHSSLETLPKQFDFPIENTNLQVSNCTIEQTEELASTEIIQDISNSEEVELRPVRSLTRQSRVSAKSVPDSGAGFARRKSSSCSSDSSSSPNSYTVTPDTAGHHQGDSSSELQQSVSQQEQMIVSGHYEDISSLSTEINNKTVLSEFQQMRKSWSNVMVELKTLLPSDYEEVNEILPSVIQNKDQSHTEQIHLKDSENVPIYSEIKYIDKKIDKNILVDKDNESLISTSDSSDTNEAKQDHAIVSTIVSPRQQQASDDSDANSINSQDTDNSPIPLDSETSEGSKSVSSKSECSSSDNEENSISPDTSRIEVKTFNNKKEEVEEDDSVDTPAADNSTSSMLIQNDENEVSSTSSSTDSSKESNSIPSSKSSSSIDNSQENKTETSVIAYREQEGNFKLLRKNKTNSHPPLKNYTYYSESRPLSSSNLVVQSISLEESNEDNEEEEEDYEPSGGYSFENLQDIDTLLKNIGKRPRQLKRGGKIEPSSSILSPINPDQSHDRITLNSCTNTSTLLPLIIKNEQRGTDEARCESSAGYFIDITSLPSSPVPGAPVVKEAAPHWFTQPPPSSLAPYKQPAPIISSDTSKSPHRRAPSPPPPAGPRTTTILVQASNCSSVRPFSSQPASLPSEAPLRPFSSHPASLPSEAPLRPFSQPTSVSSEAFVRPSENPSDENVEIRLRKSDVTDYESLHMQAEKRVSVERNASYHRAIDTERARSLEAAGGSSCRTPPRVRGGSGSRTSSRIPRPILKSTLRHSDELVTPTHRVTEL